MAIGNPADRIGVRIVEYEDQKRQSGEPGGLNEPRVHAGDETKEEEVPSDAVHMRHHGRLWPEPPVDVMREGAQRTKERNEVAGVRPPRDDDSAFDECIVDRPGLAERVQVYPRMDETLDGRFRHPQ